MSLPLAGTRVCCCPLCGRPPLTQQGAARWGASTASGAGTTAANAANAAVMVSTETDFLSVAVGRRLQESSQLLLTYEIILWDCGKGGSQEEEEEPRNKTLKERESSGRERVGAANKKDLLDCPGTPTATPATTAPPPPSARLLE